MKSGVGGPAPKPVLAEGQTRLPGVTEIQLFKAVGSGLKPLQAVSVHTGAPPSEPERALPHTLPLSRTFRGPCGQCHGNWVPSPV